MHLLFNSFHRSGARDHCLDLVPVRNTQISPDQITLVVENEKSRHTSHVIATRHFLAHFVKDAQPCHPRLPLQFPLQPVRGRLCQQAWYSGVTERLEHDRFALTENRVYATHLRRTITEQHKKSHQAGQKNQR
jgi:hypothetical protein